MPRRWSIPLIKWCGHSCFWGGVFPGSCDGVGPGSLHMAGQRRGRHVQMISAIDSVLLRAVYYCWTSLPSNGLSIDAPLSARLSFEGSDPLSTASSRVQIGHWVCLNCRWQSVLRYCCPAKNLCLGQVANLCPP